MKPTTKDVLNGGHEAFVALMIQVQHMLDLIAFYQERYPASGAEEHDALAVKHEQLNTAVHSLGTLPRLMADQFVRWKQNQPRILSKVGIETQVLNEIWVNLEALSMFFEREDIDLHPFNKFKARTAFDELVTVNRIVE